VARHAGAPFGNRGSHDRSPLRSDEDRAAVVVEVEAEPDDELYGDRLARGSGRLRGRGECWSRRGQCRMASRRAAPVSTGTVPRGTTSRMEGPHTRKSRQRRLDVFRPPEGDRRRHEGSHTSLENAMERCCHAPTARLRLSRGHGAPLGTRRVIAFNCATMTFRSQSYAIVCPTT
jgi:hypothetical protein